MSRKILTTPRRLEYKKFMQRHGEPWIKYEDLDTDPELVASGEGDAAEDNEYFLTGTSAIKLTVEGSENYSRVRKQFITDGPQDVTGKMFTLWFYLHDQPARDSPERQKIAVHLAETFNDTASGNYLRVDPAADARGTYNTQLTVGWNALQFYVDDMEQPGNPVDLTNINYVYVYCDKETNASRDYSITPDSIYMQQRSRGKLIFQDDDSPASTYTEIFGYLYGVHGYRGMSNIISGDIDSGAERLTLANLQEMRAVKWQIGGHSDNEFPFTDYEDNEALGHANNCRDFIVGNDLGDGLDGAYPQGAYTDRFIELMDAAGYRWWRTVNPKYIPNPHMNITDAIESRSIGGLKMTSAFTFRADTVEADWVTAYQALARYGGITVVTAHQIVDDDADPGNVAVGIETDRSVYRAGIDEAVRLAKLGHFDIVTFEDINAGG